MRENAKSSARWAPKQLISWVAESAHHYCGMNSECFDPPVDYDVLSMHGLETDTPHNDGREEFVE